MEQKSLEFNKKYEIYSNDDQKFSVGSLPIYTETELAQAANENLNFFKNNNFLVLPNESLEWSRQRDVFNYHESHLDYNTQEVRLNLLSERGRVGVKLGNLYIEYEMGGKGSFGLSVTLLDYKNKSTKLLINNLEQGRFHTLRLDDLVPFFSLYNATVFGRGPDKQLSEKAHAVRDVVRRLALGENVDKSEFLKVYTAFLAEGYITEKTSQPQASHIGDKTNQHSIEKVKEFAEKLFMLYINELTVTKADVIKALKDYSTQTGMAVDETLLKGILDTFVDQNRYPLHHLLDVITPEVQDEILKEFGQVKAKPTPTQYGQPEPEGTSASRKNVASIFINSKMMFFPEDLNPKEREQYIIEDVKQKLRNAITESLGKFYNVAASSILGQSLGKALGLPVDNLKYMKLVLEWVGETVKYKSLEDFHGKISPFIKKIEPFGTNNFSNKAHDYMQEIENALVEKSRLEVSTYR